MIEFWLTITLITSVTAAAVVAAAFVVLQYKLEQDMKLFLKELYFPYKD